jgi:hypothetical protein
MREDRSKDGPAMASGLFGFVCALGDKDKA